MRIENVIVGAGPAGLAVAAQLRNAGLDFEIIEQSDKIANKWHQHYDRLHLHTVKELSSLPFVDFPEEYPTYISKHQLITYYEQYANQFKLNVQFNTQLISLLKNKELWQLTCANGKYFEADNVIIATGLNCIPKIPNWKGKDLFQGEIIHAANYKNPKIFIGKKVLVVGMGNTGAEIALDLAEHHIDTSIAIRGEVLIVPRDLFGNSVQLTAKKLENLPFGLGDWIGSLSTYIAFGNLRKYGLRISKIAPAALRRVHGKTPTIDLGTVQQIKNGNIKIRGDIASLSERGVIFTNDSVENFDVILLATGYYANINSYLHNADAILDPTGEPMVKAGTSDHKGLYFIGFEKYSYAGVLGTLKAESAEILRMIKEIE